MIIKNIFKKSVACVCMCLSTLMLATCVSASGKKGANKLQPNNSGNQKSTQPHRPKHVTFRKEEEQQKQQVNFFNGLSHYAKVFGDIPGMLELAGLPPKRDNEICVELSNVSEQAFQTFRYGKFDICGLSTAKAREIAESVLSSKGFACAEFRVYEVKKRKLDGTFSDAEELILKSIPYVLGVEKGYRCYGYIDVHTGDEIVKVFTPQWHRQHPNC